MEGGRDFAAALRTDAQKGAIMSNYDPRRDFKASMRGAYID